MLAREPVKARVSRLVSPPLERPTYVWVASLLFIAACLAWRPIAGTVYRIPPPWAWAAGALQFAGGILTLDAARRIDVRVLAGLRPEPAQDGDPVARGAYRFVRHPIYLGWVLLVWAASDMTTGRLVFAAISTAYLVVAVPFEERSLRRRFGPSYDAYRRQRPLAHRARAVLMAVVFYVTGHGFGHAVRQIAIVNALAQRRPDVPIVLRTSVAPWLFARSVRASVRLEAGPVDTGAVQRGSLDVDIPATLAAAQAFYADGDAWIAREAAFLTGERARLVVADIPPLPIAAARRAGVPAIGISNFTWDWIYEDYDARRLAPGLVETLEAHYASRRRGLAAADARRLRQHRDAARSAARRPRRAGSRATWCAPRWACRRSGRWCWCRSAATAPAASTCTPPPRRCAAWPTSSPRRTTRSRRATASTASTKRRCTGSGIRYEDLVGAVDIVASKPGYGIISDCAANATALLYTDRGRFCEYDVLVREMPRYRGGGVHRPGGPAGRTLARRRRGASGASAAGRGAGRRRDDGGRLAVGSWTLGVGDRGVRSGDQRRP